MNNRKTSQIAELANQYGRQVFQTAYRLLGDKYLAEDIVQDIFLKLFKKEQKTLDGINSWPAYLKVMTTSASYDLLRKKVRLAEQAIEASDSAVLETDKQSTTPDKQLLIDKDMHRFRSALSQLSQLEANVFSLRHIEEFSYQEIAEQLSITKSNVGICLNRAKQKLSQLLNESQFLGASYEAK